MMSALIRHKIAIKQKQGKKQAAFEVYRALAVMMVVIGHFSAAAKDLSPLSRDIGFAVSAYGVPLFFIISGFLLSASFMSALKKAHNHVSVAVGVFLIKRVLRIYPAYVVSLVILALYHEAQAIDVWVHLLNIHNLFSGFSRSINGVYWTLAVEFQWYLVAPWCILFFVRSRVKVVLFALFGAIFFSFLVRWILVYDYMRQTLDLSDLGWLGQDQLYIHLFNFLLGVTVYKFRHVQINIPITAVFFLLMLLFGIGYIESGLLADIVNYHGSAILYKVLLSSFSIIVLAIIVTYFLNLEIGPKCYRVISFVSTISYSLYIYHLPILNYIGSYNISWYLFLPVYLFSSMSVALLSYYAVERPFLQYSAALTSRQ